MKWQYLAAESWNWVERKEWYDQHQCFDTSSVNPPILEMFARFARDAMSREANDIMVATTLSSTTVWHVLHRFRLEAV